MKRFTFITLLIVTSFAVVRGADKNFRPPAVPLIVCDPYFSIWSMTDKLTDDVTRHWSGTQKSMVSLISIDSRTYRIMGGSELMPRRTSIDVMDQKSVRVLPTRTIYHFEAAGISLTLTFMTPTLAHDLDVLARPVTYVTWSAKSIDGKTHAVKIYFDSTAQFVVNTLDQKVLASRYQLGDLTALRVGTIEQPVLERDGDWLRIDWGYLYVTAPPESGTRSVIANSRLSRSRFIGSGTIPENDDLMGPQRAGEYGGGLW